MQDERTEALPPTAPAAPRPSFKGLRPASPRATVAARGSSKKADTRCEVALRRALWTRGYRYRKNFAGLPGRPDVIFPGPKVAVFCDGDFWHGRDWESRSQKLGKGSNPSYWLAKIQRNMERDRQNTCHLQSMGWTVVRLWESQIRSDPAGSAQTVIAALHRGSHPLDKASLDSVKKA